jgi:ABC-type transporter Mla subunit MlaD
LTDQWVRDMAMLVEPYTLEISIGMLILLWVLFFIRYHLYLIRPILKELIRFSKFLSGLSNMEDQNESLISKFLSDLNSKSVLNPIWIEYLENHHVDSDLESYFSEESILVLAAKQEKAQSVPAFLLAVGLLGSFFSLLFSLMSLPEGAVLSSSLYPIISELILIVIFAILVSYLNCMLNKACYAKAEYEVCEIQKLLKRKLPQAKSDSKFEYISTAINNLTSSLSTYAQYTNDIQRDGMNHMVDSFLESLYGHTHGQIQILGDALRNLSVNQAQSNEQTKALVDELTRGLKNQGAFNSASESIVSSISMYQQEMADSSRHLTASMEELKGLSQSLSDIVRFNSDVLETMRAERENLVVEYNNYIQCLSKEIQGYQEDTSSKWEQAMTRFSEVTTASFNQLERSVTQAVNTLIDSNQSLNRSLEDQSKNMNYVSNEIAQRLHELNGSLKETMTNFTEAVGEGTGKTIAEFDEGLSEITQRLSQTIIEIRDSIDDLPIVIDSLKKHLE